MPLFDYQWIDVPPYPDPIAYHTMARLTINLGGQLATRLRHGDRYLEHIEVPMSHVAEWVVSNWWHLFFEADTAYGSSRSGFASRHDLSYAGNGFVFPRLIFRSEGKYIVVTSVRWWAKHANTEFVVQGEQVFESISLQKELQDLVEQVISRLNEKNVEDVPWIEEWNEINNNLDHDEKEFCIATAMLGLKLTLFSISRRSNISRKFENF